MRNPRIHWPPSRTAVLEAALRAVTSANEEARLERERLRAENMRLSNENARLRSALADYTARAAAQPRPYAAHEITAGTIVGPRRRTGGPRSR